MPSPLSSVPSSVAEEGLDTLTVAMPTGFQCAGCGQWNHTVVDPSAGRHQVYVEDCQVCCRANLLTADYDPEAEEFLVSAALES